jgi:hypothetical protein
MQSGLLWFWLQDVKGLHVTLSWMWDSIKLQALQEPRRYAIPFSAERISWRHSSNRWLFESEFPVQNGPPAQSLRHCRIVGIF